ncbi:GGDEF domain-containing protein [Synechococcus sp. RSCCF101]|uniref:GGDEF domain-containing protein n=1 Tax=Synechococcus sp. RSCCF101 TaxID=2511069 RepID=UPI00124675CD|nr:GGDEF domain-containing protein [Synechococcus sp. RSCCF101]QEY31179.1 GGDEF domain-containing protein [Synechococcus sp. RSCCF101]
MAVPTAELQNKADRYYFSEAMTLPPGAVYLSPLDLNKERGQIEQPLKPMIRVAIPLFSEAGERRGIVIVNYLASNLLDDLSRSSEQLEENPMLDPHLILINREGFWLRGPDPATDWEFMYERDSSFLSRYPEVFAAMRRSPQRQLQQERLATGLWTWQTLNPLDRMLEAQNPRFCPDPQQAQASSRSINSCLWIVASRVSPAQLTAITRAGYRSTLGVAAILLLTLALASLAVGNLLEERARQQRELKRLASTDTLTGLPNRRTFMTELRQATRIVRRHPHFSVGVIMLDLDHFKAVNDTYGHAAGDAVLKHVSAVIRRSLRESDTGSRLDSMEFADSSGRLGGEEFAVLLRSTSLTGVREMGERLRRALESSPVAIDDGTLTVTMSLGGSLIDAADVSGEEALMRADRALYAAKDGGRNRMATLEAGDAEPKPVSSSATD